MRHYEKIEALARRVHHLQHLQAITGWDEAVMMPEGGGEARAAALAELNVLIHETYSQPQVAEWIEGARAELEGADPWKKANLREFERTWRQQTCLPSDFVQARTLAVMRGEQAWRGMRGKNDWQGFRPLLEENFRLARQEGALRAEASGLQPYDALLDLYEPGVRADSLTRTFSDLEGFLPEFIAAVREKQADEKFLPTRGKFPIERQRALGLELMGKVGFDFQHGRLDVSHHPFCGGVPADVRITTRYREDDFSQSMMGVLHETGHAKYEQNLPATWRTQPVGLARGMGVHESQSLFLEMQVARSREFLEFAAPFIEKHLGAGAEDAVALRADNLFSIFTRVKPGYIRVDADEVTYPCHVILRFKLERALISGDLKVKDLPDAWDAGMRASLGLSTGDNHKDGCMQDVHWAGGAIGYFPSYTLGALIAAQLMAALEKEIPNVRKDFAAGEFGGMNDWLRRRVWSQGSFFTTDDLLRQATGATLSTEAYKNHVRRRYLDS
ncbi:MAG TPA: carboxypeptidase M32 [Bdellovibrionota bacterium]|nr:carboxypeptidase M32 [Bdellovibrionota bacterium]